MRSPYGPVQRPVMLIAQPAHFKRLAIVVMVSVSLRIAAYLAALAYQATGLDCVMHSPAGANLLGIALCLDFLVTIWLLTDPALPVRVFLPAGHGRPQAAQKKQDTFPATARMCRPGAAIIFLAAPGAC